MVIPKCSDLVRWNDVFYTVLLLTGDEAALVSGATRAVSGVPTPLFTAPVGELEVIGAVDFSSPFHRQG
jgi:hypothetical protein